MQQDIDLPVYEEISPDFMLIGVDHAPIKPGKKTAKVDKLIKTVRKLSHLAFEGDRRLVEVVAPRFGVHNFERVARVNFQKQVHYLDEGANYVQLADAVGMSPKQFAIFHILSGIPGILSMGNVGLSAFLDLLDKKIDISAGPDFSYYGFGQVNLAEVKDFFRKNAPYLFASMDTVNALCAAGQEFQHYFARLRDQNLYFPRLQQMRATLKGRVGAILGADHLPNLKQRFAGDSTQLSDWDTFVAGVSDERASEGFELVEKALKGSSGAVFNQVFSSIFR